MNNAASRLLIIGLILAGGILPIASYWYYIGQVPAVTPTEAKVMLVSSQIPTVLIDIRSAGEFDTSHLSGAVNWPKLAIEALQSNQPIPKHFQDGRLLLYCNSGIESAMAAQKLRRDFGLEAFNIAGGLEAWMASIDDPETPVFVNSCGQTAPVPYIESPVSEQAALVAAILFFKPTYMFLSAALIIWLWRVRSPIIRVIKWGLVAFLAGEMACAVNIIFFNYADYFLELLHSWGMFVGFAFFAFALIELLDTRLLKYSESDTGCALREYCHQCAKSDNRRCKLKQITLLAIITLFVLTFIPLTTDIISVSYNTTVFNIHLNYSHPVVYQVFETRYAPIYALIMLGAAMMGWIANHGGFRLAKMLLAAGVGALGFSLLRLVVFHFYSDSLVWFEFWEETTELLFIGTVAALILALKKTPGLERP